MNQIALCDWLPERATWSYLARSGLAAVSREKKIPREPNNKSHIDLAFSVNMARYWPLLFASLWTTQKRTWPISSHLDRKSLVNNPYICCIFVHPALDSAPLQELRGSLFTLMRIQPAFPKDVFSGAFRQKLSQTRICHFSVNRVILQSGYMMFKFIFQTIRRKEEGHVTVLV